MVAVLYEMLQDPESSVSFILPVVCVLHFYGHLVIQYFCSRSSQDLLHNLWSLMQDENAGPLVQKIIQNFQTSAAKR